MGSFRSQDTSIMGPGAFSRTQLLPVMPLPRHAVTASTAAAAARNAILGVAFFHESTCFTRRAASCSPKASAAGMGAAAAWATNDKLYPRLASLPRSSSTTSSQLISISRQKSTQQSHTAGSHQYTASKHHPKSFHQGSRRRMWWRSWASTYVRSVSSRCGGR